MAIVTYVPIVVELTGKLAIWQVFFYAPLSCISCDFVVKNFPHYGK
jgi:hypothetical protein